MSGDAARQDPPQGNDLEAQLRAMADGLPDGYRDAFLAGFDRHLDEAPPPRRSGCLSVLPWLALAVLLLAADGSCTLHIGPSARQTVPEAAPARLAVSGGVTVSPAPSYAPAASGGVGTALIGGWISWADPDLGGDYLATRFPRGTLVRLCTPNRCIVRRSNDFGPSAKIDPPRIADLAVLDWESLCGLPRARGVCRGTVEAIDDLPLPPTDSAP